MARHSRKLREAARELYLTDEVTSVSEIARRLKVKPHTIAAWKQEEDWEALRLKIDRQAADKLVERLASERVNLNARHYKYWDVIGSRIVAALQKEKIDGEEIKHIERLSASIERLQKGQRVARGLALDGKTEEQIRADAEAESRALIDGFIEVVKEKVADAEVRDEIARVLLSHLRGEADEEALSGDARLP